MAQQAGVLVRRWNPEWLLTYKWLSYDRKEGKIWCTTCTEAAEKGHKPHQRNTFIRSKGSRNLQLSGIKRHVKEPTADHHRLLRLCSIYPKKNPLQYYQERERVVQQNSDAITTAVTTIFHLAKQERPLSHYEAEIRFEIVCTTLLSLIPNLDDNIFGQYHASLIRLDPTNH